MEEIATKTSDYLNLPQEIGKQKYEIAQIIFDKKSEVKKVLNKINYFKTRDYLTETTKLDVEDVLNKKVKLGENKSYTDFCKRRLESELKTMKN